MEAVLAALSILFSYLLGSIPTAYIVGRRVKGVDLRQIGSHNVGAMNAFREVGPRSGSVVLAFDILKGVLAVYLPTWLGAPSWTPYFSAAAVVAGHNWPVFLGFRGGKGVAVVVGISLAILPLMTLIVLAPTVFIFVLTRNIILAAAFGFVLLNTLTITSGQPGSQIALCLVLTFVVTATHYARTYRTIKDALKHGQWQALLSIGE